jgi:nitroreductase/Pyruvate/2-oxoacid:ferredoxin oxidoreductase delta subunit
MLDFKIDEELCIGCGQCASDCPATIIAMDDGLPVIPPDMEQFCIHCLHCFAICSEGALSILGASVRDVMELRKNLPDPEKLEVLIKGRRSVRNYQDENMEPGLIDKLLEVAWHGPSGHNDRRLLFCLVDNKDVLDSIRKEAFAGLERLVNEGRLPEGMEMFSDIMDAWKNNGVDILFRGAPHLLVVSAHEESAAPLHDAIISLATFELYAQSCGVGTIWNGLATLTITELVPGLRERLRIPDDYQVGYVMGFGMPAIRYDRTVDRGKPNLVRIGL